MDAVRGAAQQRLDPGAVASQLESAAGREHKRVAIVSGAAQLEHRLAAGEVHHSRIDAAVGAGHALGSSAVEQGAIRVGPAVGAPCASQDGPLRAQVGVERPIEIVAEQDACLRRWPCIWEACIRRSCIGRSCIRGPAIRRDGTEQAWAERICGRCRSRPGDRRPASPL